LLLLEAKFSSFEKLELDLIKLLTFEKTQVGVWQTCTQNGHTNSIVYFEMTSHQCEVMDSY
jgi:hypothetical protein